MSAIQIRAAVYAIYILFHPDGAQRESTSKINDAGRERCGKIA
jgi:hypothetical protein